MDNSHMTSPQESLEYRSRTPGKKTGMTPIRPDKVPGPNAKRRTGLLPLRPTKSPGTNKSPFGHGSKFKSGLLPIKYDTTDGGSQYSTGKSPRQKFKSGLTPIRPTKSPGQTASTNKTPHGSISSRPKSGLLPMRPGTIQNLNPLDTCNASFASRRRSGLMPIRPVRKNNTCDGNESVVSFLKPLAPVLNTSSFLSTNTTGSKPITSNVVRRTSGILPVRQSLGGFGGVTANYKLKNPTTRMSIEPKKPIVSSSKSASKNVDLKSLNTISEELESSGDSKAHNLSGIQPLDETADTSFSLRSQSKRKSSLAFRKWQKNPSQKTNTRIPVSLPAARHLNFSFEEDDEINQRSVLKDTTSKLNNLSLKTDESKLLSTGDIKEVPKEKETDNIPSSQAPVESLEEMRNRRDKLKAELADLEESIKQREAEEDVTKPRLSLESHFSDVDSPFGDINSPMLVEPAELLDPQNIHKPEDLYKIARKSCSFLKTPKPSAFRKENFPSLYGADDTPNIGSRLAQQLASLYSDS